MNKQELTNLINAALTRKDIAAHYCPEEEDIIILHEIDEDGESLGEMGYEVQVSKDNVLSIHYLEMPWSEEPFKSFAHTTSVDELMIAINAMVFHETGTN